MGFVRQKVGMLERKSVPGGGKGFMNNTTTGLNRTASANAMASTNAAMTMDGPMGTNTAAGFGISMGQVPETGTGANMGAHTPTRQSVVVPVLPQSTSQAISVDGLFGRLQTVVANARKTHPELTDYHLHDVALRMEDGELRAVLDFRR